MYAVVDQLPRLGKRANYLLLFACNYVVTVFLWVLGVGCVILLWHTLSIPNNYLSSVVRNPAFCICENKDADQLRGNREADQRLCFRYTDSTIPLLP